MEPRPDLAIPIAPGTHDWGRAASTLVRVSSGGGTFCFDRLTFGVMLRPLRRHVARYGDTRSREVPLSSGTGWLIGAGVDGDCAWDGESAFLNLALDDGVLRDVSGDAALPDFDARYAFSDATALRLALELHQAVGDDAITRMYRDTLTLALGAQLLKAIRVSRAHTTQGLADARLARAAALIEERLAAPLSLNDLANAAGLSPFHFARAFKAAYGMPPHRYLATRRIERAKQWLCTTRLPVTEIVERVGYSNASHFSAAFRRFTGSTPAQFRAR